MAANDATVDIAAPLVFSYRYPVPPGEVSATDFIAALDNRRLKNGWDDARTMGFMSGCLRGVAHSWFANTLRDWLTPAEYTAMEGDWAAFKQLFAERFRMAAIDHALKKYDFRPQRRQEEAATYAQRTHDML